MFISFWLSAVAQLSDRGHLAFKSLTSAFSKIKKQASYTKLVAYCHKTLLSKLLVDSLSFNSNFKCC